VKEPRFEIHSCWNGHLEAVHGDIGSAIRYAEQLKVEFGESFCIVDLHLDNDDGDDQIVWRQAHPTDQARAEMRKWARRRYEAASVKTRDKSAS
jgi:hypothetical protein